MSIRRVVVRLHGSLVQSVGKREVVLLLRNNEDIGKIVERLGLDEQENLMFMIGDKVVYEDYVPRDGDVIDIYPLSFGG